MRLTFHTQEANSLGQLLSGHIRQYAEKNTSSAITHGDLGKVERKFHGDVSDGESYQRVARKHSFEFTDPIWTLFGQFTPQVLAGLVKRNPIVSEESGPIIPGFKEAIDIIIEATPTDFGLSVPALNIDKGGLASNTAEALRLLEMHSNYIGLLGKGPRANLHNDLIDAAGIHRTQSVFSDEDAYLHTCIFFDGENRQQEYWMAQYRKLFPQHTIDEFTDMISRACKQHSGEALVLSAIPPAGAGNDYFSKLVNIAAENGNPTMFNAKEFDPMRTAVSSMFSQRKIGYAKLNLVEFSEFLQYANLIEDSEQAMRGLVKRLKEQIARGKFDETIELARKLIDKVNPDMVVFLSYGEHGAMAVSRKHAVLTSAPKIGTKGCSSGAGDSGLASILKAAKDHKIALLNELSDDKLAKLVESFVWGASATADLPGNQIAGLNEIASLQSGQELVTQIRGFK